MSKGIAISDIHMFSKRSIGTGNAESLYERISKADACVLNGDIFDFRWTSLPSIEETVDRAESFLRDLISKFPACRFHFVCGNHDSYPPFVERLERISEEYPAFSWDLLRTRIGNNLFLHGDIIDAAKQGKSIEEYRHSFHVGGKQGALMNFLYDILIRTGLHRIIVFVHREPELAEILIRFLRERDPSMLEGTSDIYFGHTHVPFESYLHDGITFHNSGSMIRGLTFSPCGFEF